VAHDGIGAAVDDVLALGDLDCAGGEGILAEGEEDDEEADGDHRVANE
jgi:hypothetical protein